MEQWTLTPGLDETSRWAFIVGAPRCGTTAMSEYLREHPDVCFSTPKETHYFLMHDLRCREPAVIESANKYLGTRVADPVRVFAAIRDWKNRF